jgi:hypothetical protein
MQDRKADSNAGETCRGRANRKSYAGQAESSRVGRQMQDRKVGKHSHWQTSVHRRGRQTQGLQVDAGYTGRQKQEQSRQTTADGVQTAAADGEPVDRFWTSVQRIADK